MEKLKWIRQSSYYQKTEDGKYIMVRQTGYDNGKRYFRWSFQELYNEVNGIKQYKIVKVMQYLKNLKEWADIYIGYLSEIKESN